MVEPTGPNELPFNEEAYHKIKHYLKTSHYVPARMVEQVATAEYEANYFRKLGGVVGAVTFPLFFKFPVIRTLPGLQRLGVSLLISGLLWKHLNYLGNIMQEERVINVWRKFIIFHNGHPRVFS